METPTPADCCEHCKHFHRYYVRSSGNRYTPLRFGHCSEPRFRDKQTDTPACHRFSRRPEPRK